MKKILFLCFIIGSILLIYQCNEETVSSNNFNPTQSAEIPSEVEVFERNPLPIEEEPEPSPPPPEESAPAATTGTWSEVPVQKALTASATLTPTSLTTTLMPGQSVTEHKLLHLPADVTPPRGDILFAIDLTGSMGGELNNVKANSISIMNSLRALIPDCNFGVVSHMDYNGSFSGCDYSDKYGTTGDYPYQLNQALTSTISDVSTAITGLTLGNGWDGPEDYTRVLYESYADAATGWRDGAKKILLYWQDHIPHDCNYRLDCGGSGTTGPDPGRDAVVGTADDLDLATVLQAMADDNITLIALHSSSSYLSIWDCYAAKTGGDAIKINSNGTVPDGSNIAEFVANLIKEEIKHIDNLTLEVCTPGYEGWLTSVAPASYTGIDLDTDKDFEFDIAITVPGGTPFGEYCFEVCAVGDGVEYATQQVCITVEDVTPPVITCPADVVLECPAETNPAATGSATATDNADPNPTITYADATEGTCPTVITRTWTATDASGNSSTCVQVITVEDTTPPMFTVVPPTTVVDLSDDNAAQIAAWIASAAAIDACSEVAVTNTAPVLEGGACGKTGTATVNWTAADACENITTVTSTFTVNDISAITLVTAGVVSTEGAPTISTTLTATLYNEGGEVLNISGEVVTFVLTAEGVATITVTGTTINGVAEVTVDLEPALYTIVAQSDCAVAEGSAYLVIFNPEGGFATGGGWIIPSDDGENTRPGNRANFGFNAKYKKGKPTGHIEFRYSDGYIDLKSTSIEQLVITGKKIAQFKGWANVNGTAGNWFFAKAIDNGEPGTNDTFKIKIWFAGVDPEGNPSDVAGGTLSGGNIVVHIKK